MVSLYINGYSSIVQQKPFPSRKYINFSNLQYKRRRRQFVNKFLILGYIRAFQIFYSICDEDFDVCFQCCVYDNPTSYIMVRFPRAFWPGSNYTNLLKTLINIIKGKFFKIANFQFSTKLIKNDCFQHFYSSVITVVPSKTSFEIFKSMKDFNFLNETNSNIRLNLTYFDAPHSTKCICLFCRDLTTLCVNKNCNSCEKISCSCYVENKLIL